MTFLYAILWRARYGPEEFDRALPLLLAWQHNLKRSGALRGTTGFEDGDSGVTLVEADSVEAAARIADSAPVAWRQACTFLVWEVTKTADDDEPSPPRPFFSPGSGDRIA